VMKVASSILLAFLIWSLALPAWADVAIVKHDAFTAGAAVTTLTKSITIDAATNALYVCVQARGVNNNFATSVVFNGSENLTNAGTVATGNNVKVEFWRLDAAPTVTTANVVITWAATADTIHSANGDAMQFSGADTSAGDGFNTSTGTSTAPSSDITTALNGSMAIGCVMSQASGGLTIGASGVQQQNNTANSMGHGSSTLAKPTAGSATLNWTQSSAGWAMIIRGIKELAAGASTCKGSLMLMGAGGC